MESTFIAFVGVDWGDQIHQVGLVDSAGDLQQRRFEHSGVGLADLIRWLSEVCTGASERLAVAIEVPHGPIVDALLDGGFAVFSLNPKQLDRFRDRYTVAGAKDDRRDARVLATSLRTDLKAFRRLSVSDPRVIRLRELTRLDEELKTELRRLANRLRAQLQRYYPQVLALNTAADEEWQWVLLERAPDPERGRRLKRTGIAHLLRHCGVRRISAEAIAEALARPPLPVANGVTEAAVTHVEMLLPRLKLASQQHAQCLSAIRSVLKELEVDQSEHRDVAILQSLPGAGIYVSATMLAEGFALLRSRDYHSLRVQAGVAPVTRQSGKTLRVVMRRACNARLRNALYHWSRSAVQHDQRSRRLYQAQRQRGHSHGRALRTVADRMLRLLMILLQRQETYLIQKAA